MVLVDTSVWISHFKKANRRLQALLKDVIVLSHPFIAGELACGSLTNRQEILSLVKTLPQGKIAETEEIEIFIEKKALYGKGIGLIDIHLLASAKLSSARLWTLDKKLERVAQEIKVAYL